MPDPPHPNGPIEDVRRELERFADDWAAAIVSNDADAIGAYMAEDWVMVSETGISTRDDFLAAVRSGTLTHSAMDRVGPLQIRRVGEVAVLTARVTNTAHVGDQQFDADEWTTDLVIGVGCHWVCLHSQITPAAREPDIG